MGLARRDFCGHGLHEILPNLQNPRAENLPRLLIRRLILVSAALCFAALVFALATAVVFAQSPLPQTTLSDVV
jgi:hypothetical protein